MENKRLFGKLCYLHRQMCRENDVLFAENGITPVQMHVLMYVGSESVKGERVCQKDVEKRINLRASSVSSLLSTLEREGFLSRTVSEGDARTKFLALTEKGKSICVKKKFLMDACDGAIQSALTEEEQNAFENLLNKILKSISEKEDV